MEKISVEDVEPNTISGDVDRRDFANPLGASDVAINQYTLQPGKSFSSVLHTHLDQEEIFYVIEGEATFETAAEPDAETETVTVGSGEVIRFAPGEYQEGRNESDDEVVALALGAPKNSTESRVARTCPSCGSPAMDIGTSEDGWVLECPDCDETAEADF